MFDLNDLRQRISEAQKIVTFLPTREELGKLQSENESFDAFHAVDNDAAAQLLVAEATALQTEQLKRIADALASFVAGADGQQPDFLYHLSFILQDAALSFKRR